MKEELLQRNLTEVSTLAQPVTNPHWELFVTLVAISLVCLLITLILYLLTWEKHNCQGWTQFSYLLALFLFDCFFVVALCPGLSNGVDRDPTCKILSILNQYFFICAKTWLIIISLDLFCTIRNMRVVNGGNSKNLFRFIIYSSIGWTFPLVFVTIGIILNLQHQFNLPRTGNATANNVDNLWSPFPDYGFRHCRIPTWAIWEYFVYGNCLFHISMFGVISLSILWQRRRINSLADISSSAGRPSPFLMLLRLFIVVGISWSYIALQDILKAGNINTPQHWGWHLFRGLFFLQGVFVSVITITNGKTMSNLVGKYPRLKVVQKGMRFDGGGVIGGIRHKLCRKSRKESLQSCVSQRTVNSIVA